MIAVKLSESESWIKLVTSNYCTCDLWTTLLLGGKTFPIIEAFFFWFWILAPFNHPRHLESIQYIFPYIKYLPQRWRTPLTRLSNENSRSLYARGKLSPITLPIFWTSHNAASCQTRSQCPLRTQGTRLVSSPHPSRSPLPLMRHLTGKRLNGPGSSGDDYV